MDNEEYRMISVKVWKKDGLCCLQPMEELKGKILLFAHLPDQPETAAWLKPLDISRAYDQLHMVTWFS